MEQGERRKKIQPRMHADKNGAGSIDRHGFSHIPPDGQNSTVHPQSKFFAWIVQE